MTVETKNVAAPDEAEYSFIGRLKALLENPDRSQARAAMAHLRRGLGKPAGIAYEMDKYVLGLLPADASRRQEEVYYLVAALFAFWHQGRDKAEGLKGDRNTERNPGRSLRLLVNREEPGARDNLEKSIEKRLNALLNSHREDVGEHLRRTTALLKSKDVPLNWMQLLHDLQFWDTESRSVQHAWARGFWARSKEDQAETTGVSGSQNE